MKCALLASGIPAATVASTSSSPTQFRRLKPLISTSIPFLSYSSAQPFVGHNRPFSWRPRTSDIVCGNVLQDGKQVIVPDSFQTKNIPHVDAESAVVDSLVDTSETDESWIVKLEHSINFVLTESVIKILDVLYRDRHYARFYVLETIARVPYFAFTSVLHLYESCGWWRRADYLKVHFAESWNELHHLLIMEELGGNEFWFDRFLSQHIAIFYYFLTVFMYALSPRMAYNFSECVEKHAYSTYDKFLKLQGDELKKLPAPQIAIKYYMDEDLYMFDEFQTSRAPNTRRPKIENLYDVFLNVRDDEAEHCKTMRACQVHGNLRSPHSKQEPQEHDSGCVLPDDSCEGLVDCLKKSFTPPGRRALGSD